MPTPTIQSLASVVLLSDSAQAKLASTEQAWQAIQSSAVRFEHDAPPEPLDDPGRPSRPELVAPKFLKQRTLSTLAGRAALLHAVAHIEFNAINLAWDAVYRFPNMPRQYYLDWASVAHDEARHFALLEARLRMLGFSYGDFPAHNGLWEMAIKTRDDIVHRMALVPRLLEARGLDVTPVIIEKLKRAGDTESSDVLELILREEIRHVEIGSNWFNQCCATRDLDPAPTFLNLLKTLAPTQLRLPFNRSARVLAGFGEAELAGLEAYASTYSNPQN
jgi:uncharacterized ferritin-like protein (DUF455 family)